MQKKKNNDHETQKRFITMVFISKLNKSRLSFVMKNYITSYCLKRRLDQ